MDDSGNSGSSGTLIQQMGHKKSSNKLYPGKEKTVLSREYNYSRRDCDYPVYRLRESPLQRTVYRTVDMWPHVMMLCVHLIDSTLCNMCDEDVEYSSLRSDEKCDPA